MTPQELRFGINGLTGIVVLSVAAALATLTWRLAGEAGGASAVTAATEAYVPPAPPPDLTAMINLPPFGRAMVAPTAMTASVDLVLRGVLLANPATASSALIATGDKVSIAYGIGDPLPGGVMLNGIGIDYVLLRRGEQFYTLYFPGDPRAGQPAVAVAAPGTQGANERSGAAAASGVEAIRSLIPPSVQGRPQATPPAPPPQAPPPAPAQSPPPPPPPQNSRSGNALIDSLGATVTPQGYRVGSALSPQLRGAGLAPGDVVATVNGVNAATFAADPRRLAEALASGQARVEVLRNGTRTTLTVPVR